MNDSEGLWPTATREGDTKCRMGRRVKEAIATGTTENQTEK